MLGLDAATWARLSPLLDEALALPAAERAAWLARLPPEFADLAPRLARLLDPTASPLPEAPPAGLLDEGPVRQAGDRIGPWCLIGLLGRGGMGEVWLAERTDGGLQRRVALKLPHADRLQAGLAARIARERDILAALEHPAIARLYDAGIDDGQPWLALEAVRGHRLDEWCDLRRAGVAERIALFEQAAAAVAYAHAQLVVHRDLKPSNLLVDEAGQVHLLDFGIARLLDAGGSVVPDLTARGAAAMTPAYASPEQVAGLPVGTASDLYSLGVLLYELLAGTSPYRPARSTRPALEDAVLGELPRRPSDACADAARRRLLRGDLDAIVLQALAKDPRQRYPTVDALLEDLQRWRRHEPVRARRAGMAYELAKFMRRHRVGVAAGGAVVLALVGGAALAWWQAGRAELERERAEQVKGFLTGLLRDASPQHAGDVGRLTAADLMRQAAERLSAAGIAQPSVRVELATLIGESLVILGDYDRAEPLLQDAARQGRAELGDAHGLTLQARLNQAHMLRLRGRVGEQQRELLALAPLLREAGRREPAVLVQGLQHLALNAIDRGAHDEAEAHATEGFELARRTLGDRHPDTVAGAVLLALTHRYAQHPAQAVRQGALALQLTEALHPQSLHPRRAEARAVYGRALADAGELAAGVAQMRQAIDETSRLFGAESPPLGLMRQNLVGLLVDLGDLDGAQAEADEALRLLRLSTAAGSFPEVATRLSQAQVSLERGRAAEVLPALTEIAQRLESLVGPAHDQTQRAAVLLARAEVASGRLEAAAARLDAMPPPRHPRTAVLHDRARATLLLARRETSAAQRLLGPLLAEGEAEPWRRRERAFARAELGLALQAAGQAARAQPLMLQARAELAALQTHPTPLTRALGSALDADP